MHKAMGLALVLVGCGGGPVTGSLVCDEAADEAVAVYRAKSKDAGSVHAVVDTVDAATAFDPAVTLISVTSWTETVASLPIDAELAYADDDFACTFPPPDYECPELTATVPATEQDLGVIVEVVGSCAGTEAGYELLVERDGKPLKLKLVATGTYDDLDFPVVDTGI